MWSTYVVSDPRQLIQGDVSWSVAAQPRTEAQLVEGDNAANSRSMDPQYLVTRLPGQTEPEFVLQRAFVPRSGDAGSTTARPELTGIMMARSDPENYGELVLYNIPSGLVEAPDFVHSEIRKNDDLTEFLKEKIGSVVSFGEMTLLLVNDTIVYVRPVYVEAASATAVPELSKVIAVNGENIAMGDTLDEALSAIVDGPVVSIEAGTDEDADDGDVEAPPTDTPAGDYDPSGRSVVDLINDADEFLTRADALETAGRADDAAILRSQARLALAQVQELLGGPPPTIAPASTDNGET